MEGLSSSDVALLAGRDNDMFGGNGSGSWMWFLALLVLMGGGFGFNRGPVGPTDVVTQPELSAAINNQTVQQQLQQIALSSANNNYETAQLINAQTNQLLQLHNTDQMNMLNQFNDLKMTNISGMATIGNKIDQLSFQLDKCCCDIKTQMLQQRLDDANAIIVSQNAQIGNAAQTQTILSTMGKWVANPASTTVAG